MLIGKEPNEVLDTLRSINGLVRNLQSCDYDEDIQFEALRSPFKEIQYACVKSPYAKEAVLLEALDSDDSNLNILAASNEAATEAVLIKALDSTSRKVKIAATKNPSATETFLLKILKENLLDIHVVLDNPAATDQVYIKAMSRDPYGVLLNPKYISETIYLAAAEKLNNCKIMFIKGYLSTNGKLVFRVNDAITPAVLSKAFDEFADKIICSYTYTSPNALFFVFTNVRVTVGYVVYHHPNSTEELKHRAEHFKNSISFRRSSECTYIGEIQEL